MGEAVEVDKVHAQAVQTSAVASAVDGAVAFAVAFAVAVAVAVAVPVPVVGAAAWAAVRLPAAAAQDVQSGHGLAVPAW